MWIRFLEGPFRVDPEGIRHLRRLATRYGMEGYKEANMIIGKLLKMQNDDRSVYRPSHFVSSSVNNSEYLSSSEEHRTSTSLPFEHRAASDGVVR